MGFMSYEKGGLYKVLIHFKYLYIHNSSNYCNYTLDQTAYIATTAHSNGKIERPLESQDYVLSSTSPTQSTILTLSSTTSQMLRNCHKNHCNRYPILNCKYLYNHWVT